MDTLFKPFPRMDYAMRPASKGTLAPAPARSSAADFAAASAAASSREPRSIPKHLSNCRIVLLHEVKDRVPLWLAELRDILAPPVCRAVDFVWMHESPERLAHQARTSDILIALFYFGDSDNLMEKIAQARRTNPQIYVVLLTLDPCDVPAGIADLVLDKNQVMNHSQTIAQLATMLSNSPSGSRAIPR